MKKSYADANTEVLDVLFNHLESCLSGTSDPQETCDILKDVTQQINQAKTQGQYKGVQHLENVSLLHATQHYHEPLDSIVELPVPIDLAYAVARLVEKIEWLKSNEKVEYKSTLRALNWLALENIDDQPNSTVACR